MSEKKIVISKRSNLKGDDGHKIFSIRIKEETVRQLDDIANQTNRSRNELIQLFLEHSLQNYIIEEND